MSFEEWFEEHREEIEQLLKDDVIEALQMVFYAGYKEGGSWVADVVREVYK